MTGYSGTPLLKKLGIKEGHVLALRSAPEDFDATLGELPDGVVVRRRVQGQNDVIVAFFTHAAELKRRFESMMGALDVDGGLWIGWPKKASGVSTDITEDVVRELALARGMVDNKVCAIDETWSGLRLVYRLADRPALRSARQTSGSKR